MFGILRILGYNFSPRFKDLADQRFWRASLPGVETGAYGPLEPLARNRVNLNKVIRHWPDMLRVVARSLVTNQVRAYNLLRMFGREGHPTLLGQAFAEYGRIAKTEHLLRVVDPVDDTYRRQMNRQLTVQESPPQAGPRRVPRQARHYPPGVPGRHGGSARIARPGPQRRGALVHPVHRRGRRPAPSRGPRDPGRGHCPALPAQAPQPQRARPLQCFTASQPVDGLRPLRDPDAVSLDDDDDGED